MYKVLHYFQITANNLQGSLGNVRKAKKDSVSCWHFPDGKEDTLAYFKLFLFKQMLITGDIWKYQELKTELLASSISHLRYQYPK